jgi:methyltransferase (TIGR00027 family)
MKADKPSDTAAGVALSMVASMRDPITSVLFSTPNEPYFEWCVEEHSEAARGQLAELKSAHRASLHEFLRESTAPGAALFTVLRKLFIEREVRAALNAGAEQVVILGGGYDPLTLRLQRAYPQVRCYELDHPATQEIKRRALEKHTALPSTLSLIPIDFAAESVTEKLLAAGFHVGTASAFVCEGVLMYLAPHQVDEIFSLIHQLGDARSRFVFTMIDKHVLDTDAHAMRLKTMVERNDEALLSCHHPSEIDDFLKHRGFRLLALGDRRTLQQAFLDPLRISRPVRDLEFAVSAETDTAGKIE